MIWYLVDRQTGEIVTHVDVESYQEATAHTATIPDGPQRLMADKHPSPAKLKRYWEVVDL